MKFELPPPLPSKRPPPQKERAPEQQMPAAKRETGRPLSLHPGESIYGDDFLPSVDQEQKQSENRSPPQSAATANSAPTAKRPTVPVTEATPAGFWVGIAALVVLVGGVALVQMSDFHESPVSSASSAGAPGEVAPEVTPTMSAAPLASDGATTQSAAATSIAPLNTPLVNVETGESVMPALPAAASAVSPTVAPTPIPRTYQVVTLQRGESLTVRTGPGVNYTPTVRLPGGLRGIILRERRYNNNGTIWQEISVGGYTGYVNEMYLKPEAPMR